MEQPKGENYTKKGLNGMIYPDSLRFHSKTKGTAEASQTHGPIDLATIAGM